MKTIGYYRLVIIFPTTPPLSRSVQLFYDIHRLITTVDTTR